MVIYQPAYYCVPPPALFCLSLSLSLSLGRPADHSDFFPSFFFLFPVALRYYWHSTAATLIPAWACLVALYTTSDCLVPEPVALVTFFFFEHETHIALFDTVMGC